MSQRHTFFPHLDGLRTIACVAVFLFHTLYGHAAMWLQPGPPLFDAGMALLGMGRMGVNFFFVLSGFLITYLLLEEEQRAGRIRVPAFYLRRVLRIWPLYFLCMAFGFGLWPWLMSWLNLPWREIARPGMFAVFLANIDLLRFPEANATSLNLSVLWSVAVEEQFYLFWPLLFVFLPLRGWRPAAFLLIIAGSFWFRYQHAALPMTVNHHTLSVISDMALGGAAGWLCFRFPAFRGRIARWPRRNILLGYGLGFMLVVGQKYLADGELGIALQRIVRGLFFVFVILEQNYARHSLFKMGNSRLLTRGGTYTYGLYCLHPMAMMLVALGLESMNLPHTISTILLLTALSAPLSIAMALLSYRYFEKPFLRLKTRLAEPAPAKTEREIPIVSSEQLVA